MRMTAAAILFALSCVPQSATLKEAGPGNAFSEINPQGRWDLEAD
jgi:hypothetical protein